MLALTAGAAYAVCTVASKHMIVRGEASATVMGSASGLGGILLVPILLTQPLAWLSQPSGVALAAHLGVMATGLAYALFGRGLAMLPAGPVTTLMLAEPVAAPRLGVTLLREPITPTGLTGAALVLAGPILQGAVATRRTSKERSRT
ncbi:DMT family transporter [Friedmanniella luteola]|uniref:DMT family transporter n=1 Tax=Friedmanniella luteola TaxID=546871 RepID=UPI0012FD5E50|nr:DMT family transporter [Friedmanniella luteola]